VAYFFMNQFMKIQEALPAFAEQGCQNTIAD